MFGGGLCYFVDCLRTEAVNWSSVEINVWVDEFLRTKSENYCSSCRFWSTKTSFLAYSLGKESQKNKKKVSTLDFSIYSISWWKEAGWNNCQFHLALFGSSFKWEIRLGLGEREGNISHEVIIKKASKQPTKAINTDSSSIPPSQ